MKNILNKYEALKAALEELGLDAETSRALSLDYDVIVLSDCTSSVTEEVQRANLGDMERIGARIETVGSLSALIG